MAIIYFDEEGQQDEAIQINAVAKSKDKLGTFACFRATHVSIFMCMREENFPHHYRECTGIHHVIIILFG